MSHFWTRWRAITWNIFTYIILKIHKLLRLFFHILDEQDLNESMAYIHVNDGSCYSTFNVVFNKAVKFVFPSTLNCNMLSIILSMELYVILKSWKNVLRIKFAQCRSEEISNISFWCKFCSDNLKTVRNNFE